MYHVLQEDMMNHRENQRERAIAALSVHLIATGLSQTSLRQLAGAAGISDRMLLYYFTDKADVLAAVMGRVAGDLAQSLAAAIPEGEPLPPAQLIARAAAHTTDAAMRPFMRLWIEVVAAAARKEEPYATIARQITAGFLQWIDARLSLPEGADRAAVAAAILALIDGLALVDVGVGNEMAERAVAALGWVTGEAE